MKTKELNEIEMEIISHLRQKSSAGDNEASKILLDYIQVVSSAIDKWKKTKDQVDKSPETE